MPHYFFHGAEESYYYIRHRDSNKFMGVSGGLNSNDSKIVLANYNYDFPRQLFKLVPTGEGLWRIIPKTSNKTLNIKSVSQNNGTALILLG